MQQQPAKKYFCFLLIRESGSSYFAYFYLPAIVLLTCLAAHQCRRLHQNKCLLRITRLIYCLIFLWAIACSTEIALSFYVYRTGSRLGTSEEANLRMERWSKGIFILAFGSIFTLQTAVILTPYHWVSSFLIFYEKYYKQSIISDNNADVEATPEEVGKFEKVCQAIIKFYLALRYYVMFAWIMSITGIFASAETEYYQFLADFTINYMLIESFMVLVFLIISICAIKMNKTLQNFVVEDDIRQYLINYYLLTLSIVCRIVVFSIRAYSPYKQLLLTVIVSDCSLTNTFQTTPFVFILLEAVLIDFLPFCVMLKIYRINQQAQQLPEIQTAEVLLSNN